MRHGKKFNHLKRKASHRKALLANMANALIEHKRIQTTLAKAKALQRFVEPLVTKSKTDTTHARRVVFRYLRDKNGVNALFRDIATQVKDRPGGYTRVIKTGFRQGDGAETALIELVDYNLTYNTEGAAKKKRTRRAGKKSSAASPAPAAVEQPGAPLEEAGEAQATQQGDPETEKPEPECE